MCQRTTNKRFGYIWNLNEWDKHLLLYHREEDKVKSAHRIEISPCPADSIFVLCAVVLC